MNFMKLILNDPDRTLLEELVKEAELKTRAQIVLAVIKRSDSYTEIPWKAFALGVSVTGLIVLAFDLFFPVWVTGTSVLLSVTAILAIAILLALLTVLLPQFARLFLTRSRRETEPLQYAESLFLSHELFATEDRRGVLLLVSLFERQMVIVPDKGVRNRLTQDIIQNIISDMSLCLRQSNLREAMKTGLNEVVKALCPPGFKQTDRNELSDKIIEEDGI